MQLYEDTRKPLNQFEIRLRSTRRGTTLGHQTTIKQMHDAGGDFWLSFDVLALGGHILVMSRHSGYIS